MKQLMALVSLVLGIATADWVEAAGLGESARLRLVPFPKKVLLQEGTFDLGRSLVLQTPEKTNPLAGALIIEEIKRAGLPAPKIVKGEGNAILLYAATNPAPASVEFSFRNGATGEDYHLTIRAGAIVCRGQGSSGLFYAVQTLCQLIRANRDGSKLPCLQIEDWPSLRWRCAQDDLTRGPSSTLATLQRDIVLGAFFKHNLWSYYMEHQYAFKKHPKIGPKNGSLEPSELKALVDYARPYYTEILGNQQSFGHWGWILKHPEYARLGENREVLSPAKEETYKLLDELYSEVCPILPFEMFNVCCDETWGLGEGPSREMARKIGVGGVYVQHIRRVHDLLQQRYKKRMMMWGDIILQHPDKLNQIPRDTVMLTWGYDPRASFEDQILPFKKSGYEFFVCPGISNWSRILPDFGVAMTNIRNFVRDGARHGALGMLNTDWEDDGESLQGYRWHGHAWGGECAWNASTTSPEDFNRRIGAVLFGEKGDHFGQAIALLAQTHRLPGMGAMLNGRFWENDFPPSRTAATIRTTAGRLLKLVRPAIEHLEACQKEATVNADLLDAFLQGARRMGLIGTRMLDGLQAAELYAQAFERDSGTALSLIDEVEKLVRVNRAAHESLGREFARLWLAECRPYALDWTMKRYAANAAWYDALLGRLAQARQAAQEGKPLTPPEKLGLMLPEKFNRRTRPQQLRKDILLPGRAEPWDEPKATHRLGLVVKAGSADRADLPIELDVPLPAETRACPVRAFCRIGTAPPREIPAQLDAAEAQGKTRLTLVLPGNLRKGTQARIHVYLGLASSGTALAEAARTSDAANGRKWLENDRVRLLLGPEGAHLYRWEVKALNHRDLTEPGESNWAGFADVGGEHRNVPSQLVCTRRGPALVQYRCTDPTGLEKVINLFAGTSWVEVILNEPVTYYWDFDNPKNFAADGPTPGEFFFSNGRRGPVGKQADGVQAQVKAPATHWAAKFNKNKVVLGLVAPERTGTFVIAPGSGAGGVGIENSPPLNHFVTYGGLVAGEPKALMDSLRQTLDFGNQPEIELWGVEQNPKPEKHRRHEK